MRLILLRHGETDWNALDRYQGHTDIELNAEGERQARRAAGGPVGDLLEDAEELVAVCSPLARARRTAEIVLQARVGAASVAVDPELMELAGGEWEGLELSAIAERWPDEHRLWRAEPALDAGPVRDPPGRPPRIMGGRPAGPLGRPAHPRPKAARLVDSSDRGHP